MGGLRTLSVSGGRSGGIAASAVVFLMMSVVADVWAHLLVGMAIGLSIWLFLRIMARRMNPALTSTEGELIEDENEDENENEDEREGDEGHGRPRGARGVASAMRRRLRSSSRLAYRELVPIESLLPSTSDAEEPDAEHPYRKAPGAGAVEHRDDAAREAAALTLFTLWAREIPGAPSAPGKHVLRSSAQGRLVGRLITRFAPGGGPRRQCVQVAPARDTKRGFAWAHRDLVATHEEISRDATIVCEVSRERLLEANDLPPEVPASWRKAHWPRIQPRLEPGEHVLSQTFTFIAVPTVEVVYCVGPHLQTIAFEGRRMLAPPASEDWVFRARLAGLRRWAVALAALPLGVLATYLLRGSYFHHAGLIALVGCVAAAAALGFGAVWRRSLQRPALAWLLAALTPAVAALAMMVRFEPSVGAARRFMEAGELSRARAELLALDGQGEWTKRTDVAAAWRELRMWRALHAPTCARATEALREVKEPTARHAVQARIDALAWREAEAAVRARRYADAQTALGCGSAALRADPLHRGLRLTIAAELGRTCLAEAHWDCAMLQARQLHELADPAAAHALLIEVQQGVKRSLDEQMAALRADPEPAGWRSLARAAVWLWARYLEITPDGKVDPRLQRSPYEPSAAELLLPGMQDSELVELVRAYGGEASEREYWEDILRGRMQVRREREEDPWRREQEVLQRLERGAGNDSPPLRR